MSTAEATTIDLNADSVDLHFNFDTSAAGDQPLSLGLPVEHIAQALGVPHADLINADAITVHQPLQDAAATQHYGLTLGFSEDPIAPEALKIPTRALMINESGATDAYHTIVGNHARGSQRFELHTDTAMGKEAMDTMLKKGLRWQVDPLKPASFDNPIMTPEHVAYGVYKSATSDGHTKYIITPGDERGVGAIHRVLELNKADTSTNFLGGRYNTKRRVTVNHEGREGIVMSHDDVKALSQPLKESLANQTVWAGKEALYAHLHPTGPAAVRSNRLVLPVTIHRKPLLSHYEGGADLKRAVTADDISRAVDGSTIEALSTTSNPAIDTVIHGKLGKGITASALERLSLDDL